MGFDQSQRAWGPIDIIKIDMHTTRSNVLLLALQNRTKLKVRFLIFRKGKCYMAVYE